MPNSGPKATFFHTLSSVIARNANRLQTNERCDNVFTSSMAACMKISESSSSGIDIMGHGGGGEKSVAGGSAGMERWENCAMSSVILGWNPSRE